LNGRVRSLGLKKGKRDGLDWFWHLLGVLLHFDLLFAAKNGKFLIKLAPKLGLLFLFGHFGS
jgi:hypothetical protein